MDAAAAASRNDWGACHMEEQDRTIEGVQLPPKGTYELDLAHTSVELVARHMLTKVRGRWE